MNEWVNVMLWIPWSFIVLTTTFPWYFRNAWPTDQRTNGPMDRRTEVQSFLWRCVNEFKKGKNKGRGKKGELKLRRTENRMWARYYVSSQRRMGRGVRGVRLTPLASDSKLRRTVNLTRKRKGKRGKKKEKGKGKRGKTRKKGRKSKFFNREKTNCLLISYLNTLFY